MIDDATRRQIAAADPARSTWLAANAGSGKTRVLTDRVARLLLSNVSPQRILCLTYTKAAAAEMQNRLFKRLGDWAMLDDSALRAQLATLGAPADVDLPNARTLFARAIETPGGLKIQTIHSFCAAILRRFPLEAGVSPQFTEMEDQAARLLRADLIEEIADGEGADAVAGIARYFSGEDLGQLTNEIASKREQFATPADLPEILGWYGQPPSLDEQELTGRVFIDDEANLLRSAADVFDAAGNTTNAKLAQTLRDAAACVPDIAALEILEGPFLFGESAKAPFCAKIDGISNAATRAKLGDDMERLNALMLRLQETREPRLALANARKTAALHRFAAAFLPAYADHKMRRGMLDFDDLIFGTRALLTDPSVAQWVLYRLDGGIDHILVDEAQDTSPAQWDVIRLLSQEFTAGEGARDNTARTIFVVGDLKQSIYSFQGADPAEFGKMRQHFAENLAASQRTLSQQSLDHSFRSSRAILSLVDQVFETTAGKGVDGATNHLAFFDEMPGRVDLWPVVPAPDKEEKTDWTDPVDLVAPNHERVVLAKQIARQIDELCKTGTIPADNGQMRRITPGDFLILVRGRGGIFPHLISEIKARGVPIAGADRLKLGAELAVKDIAALMQFLATPEDDLALASALRSPLFGLSEAALYDLAQGRTAKYLWRELEDRKADFAQAHAILRDLRDQADFLRPYDMIERVLTLHDGRRRLLARLGSEAQDGIDVLLAQALSYERNEIPSLTGFLAWLDTDNVEVKRQLDGESQQVRVMTVHGAKGLEAPIVILPDTAKPTYQLRDEVIELADGQPIWKPATAQAPTAARESFATLRNASEDENRRLLYVAMTRAEKWLIVAAAGDIGKEPDSSWYAITEGAMRASGAEDQMFEQGIGLRIEAGSWDGPIVERSESEPIQAELPHWARQPAALPAEDGQILSPSNLGGAKAIGGASDSESEEQAMRRGRQIHLLLERLPALPTDRRREYAIELLTNAEEDTASSAEAAILFEEAQAVISASHLAHLFADGTLAEIPLASPWGDQAISGIIDRLIVDDARVLAIDFKTNVTVPPSPDQVPEGLLRQMAAYAHALALIYPDKLVETAIVWTRTAQLMPLPHDMVSAYRP